MASKYEPEALRFDAEAKVDEMRSSGVLAEALYDYNFPTHLLPRLERDLHQFGLEAQAPTVTKDKKKPGRPPLHALRNCLRRMSRTFADGGLLLEIGPAKRFLEPYPSWARGVDGAIVRALEQAREKPAIVPIKVPHGLLSRVSERFNAREREFSVQALAASEAILAYYNSFARVHTDLELEFLPARLPVTLARLHGPSAHFSG